MIPFGKVHPGSTLYVPFASFAAGTGANAVVSNFVVGDIKIYKNGGTTERASTTGFTLLDTDGIDFDGLVGANGFSIDLSSNATADFFTAGASYFVFVSTVTIDSQTITFLAATFSIGYEGALIDTTIASLSSQTSFTLSTGPAEDDALNGCRVIIHDIASAVQLGLGLITDYVGASKTVTLAAGVTFTAAAGDNISILAPIDVHRVGGTVQTPGDIPAMLTTIDDFVDTEVLAIKAKTDNLPSDPADQSLIIAATDAIMTRLGTPVGADLSADIAGVPDAVGGRVIPETVAAVGVEPTLDQALSLLLARKFNFEIDGETLRIYALDGDTEIATLDIGAAPHTSCFRAT
jgi:hypothetical protein